MTRDQLWTPRVIAVAGVLGPVLCLVLLTVVLSAVRDDSSEPHPTGGASTGAPTTAAPDGPPAGVPADAQQAQVSRYVDGDTLGLTTATAGVALVLSRETTVRLLEIDTPETVDPGEPVQCYGHEATDALEGLLPIGSTVWVSADEELSDTYGRTLLYVWTSDGTFVNLEMVTNGYARALLVEPNDAYIRDIRQAQREAKAAEIGLWGACNRFGAPEHPGHGTPPTEPPPTSPPGSPGRDPRFSSCTDANAAGFGNYRRGRDREYAWYDDADGDGVVCEF